MIDGRYIFYFSLGAGLTVILMLFVGYQLDGDMGLCKLEAAGNIGETPLTCLRSWLGALSGWVAAIVAAFTATVIMLQIRLPMVENEITQLTEINDAIEQLKENLMEFSQREGNYFDAPVDQSEFGQAIEIIVSNITQKPFAALSRLEKRRIRQKVFPNYRKMLGDSGTIRGKEADQLLNNWLVASTLHCQIEHQKLVEEINRKTTWRERSSP